MADDTATDCCPIVNILRTGGSSQLATAVIQGVTMDMVHFETRRTAHQELVQADASAFGIDISKLWRRGIPPAVVQQHAEIGLVDLRF